MKPKIHHKVNWKCHTPSWQQHISTQYQQGRDSSWKPGMQYPRYWNQIECDPNAGWEAGQWVFSFFMVTFLAAGSSHLYLGRHMSGPVQCIHGDPPWTSCNIQSCQKSAAKCNQLYSFIVKESCPVDSQSPHSKCRGVFLVRQSTCSKPSQTYHKWPRAAPGKPSCA